MFFSPLEKKIKLSKVKVPLKNRRNEPQGQVGPLVMQQCNLCWHITKYSPQANTSRIARLANFIQWLSYIADTRGPKNEIIYLSLSRLGTSGSVVGILSRGT